MTDTQPKSVPTASITRAAAAALVEAARVASADIGVDMAIAVTDAGGHLKAFESMDHTPFLTHDVAIDKAWTAASFGLPTHEWTAIVQNTETAHLAHRPRVVAVGGGLPIVENGRVIGGIGLSGGNAEQDRRAAEAALGALGFEVSD